MARMSSRNDVPEAAAPEIYQIQTRARGPAGSLPLTEEILLNSPSGDLFGLTQNAGMGWNPAEVGRKQFLILSTQGGLRAPDGKPIALPIALGYHTGHWEIGLLVQAAAVAELGRCRLRTHMPYGLIALIASVALTGVYVFVTEASFWSKALVAGLLVVSLVWRYGLFLQVALSVFLLLYFTYLKSRA